MIKQAVLSILMVVLLCSCVSPFVPIILAPDNVTVISSPQELPEPVRIEMQKEVSWEDLALIIDTSRVSHHAFSRDRSFMVYKRAGGIGYDRIEMVNLATKTTETLLEQQTEFPGSAFFGGISISPDNREVIVAVYWENAVDLLKMDLATRTWQLLNIDVILGGFGETDISPKGDILAKCGKRSGDRPVVELCLLDKNGKFVRYLTSEDYFIINGRFTPDGEWVVYESRYKLYKVRVDGSGRQEVAPCALGDPLTVTDRYAVINCYVSREPKCAALFIASLNGKNFSRLGYVEPRCREDE